MMFYGYEKKLKSICEEKQLPFTQFCLGVDPCLSHFHDLIVQQTINVCNLFHSPIFHPESLFLTSSVCDCDTISKIYWRYLFGPIFFCWNKIILWVWVFVVLSWISLSFRNASGFNFLVFVWIYFPLNFWRASHSFVVYFKLLLKYGKFFIFLRL